MSEEERQFRRLSLFLCCIKNYIIQMLRNLRKKLGDTIPKELISEYNKWCRDKAKKFIIKHNINPKVISNYAEESFKNMAYEEVYTEYMRKKIMEESEK